MLVLVALEPEQRGWSGLALAKRSFGGLKTLIWLSLKFHDSWCIINLSLERQNSVIREENPVIVLIIHLAHHPTDSADLSFW